MNSAICTLFEGNYHYGVATLVNSLYAKGFRGHIYAGYKGQLPKWAKDRYTNPDLNWNNAETLKVANDCFLHFLPLETDYHLTNYKPDFMLELLDGPAKDTEAIFYYDPDIVIKCEWIFFEEWIKYGIGVVHEIIMNDMPPNHPVRMIWKKVIEDCNLEVKNSLNSYINGGFVGLLSKHKAFLENWKTIMKCGFSKYGMLPQQFDNNGLTRQHPFYMQDQDGLNMASMASPITICDAGPEFMDFVPGGLCMSHALGNPKPWNKSYLKTFITKASSPKLSDKQYWNIPNYPCKRHNYNYILFKKTVIKLTSFLSRFYSS